MKNRSHVNILKQLTAIILVAVFFISNMHIYSIFSAENNVNTALDSAYSSGVFDDFEEITEAEFLGLGNFDVHQSIDLVPLTPEEIELLGLNEPVKLEEKEPSDWNDALNDFELPYNLAPPKQTRTIKPPSDWQDKPTIFQVSNYPFDFVLEDDFVVFKTNDPQIRNSTLDFGVAGSKLDDENITVHLYDEFEENVEISRFLLLSEHTNYYFNVSLLENLRVVDYTGKVDIIDGNLNLYVERFESKPLDLRMRNVSYAIESEPNNTYQTANSMSNFENSGKIYTPTDVDWWKISYNAAYGSMIFTLTNLVLDYDMQLRDSSGNTWTSQNGGITRERIIFTGRSQTLYIKIYGYGGNYSTAWNSDYALISVYNSPSMPDSGAVIADSNNNSSGSNSSSNNSNNYYAGSTADNPITVNVGSSASGYLNGSGNVYWYKFTPSSYAHYIFETTGSTDTYGDLYDSNLRQLNYDDDSGSGSNFKLIHDLDANKTYLLRVSGYRASTSGNFNLSISRRATAGDSFDLPWPIGIQYNGNLGTGQLYYMKFTSRFSGLMDIYVDSDFDSFGLLYNSNRSLLTQDDDSNGNRDFRIRYNLTLGQVYYIVVRGYNSSQTGYYSLFMQQANTTITWNANGGTVTPATTTKTIGSQVGTLPTPVRAGYIFDGWYLNAAGTGSKIYSTIVVNAAVTFFAKWKADLYLTKDEVLAVANNRLNEHSGGSVMIDDDMQPLYDERGELLAYAVRFYRDGQDAGHINISARRDSEIYMYMIDPVIGNFANIRSSSNSGYKVKYETPFIYYTDNSRRTIEADFSDRTLDMDVAEKKTAYIQSLMLQGPNQRVTHDSKHTVAQLSSERNASSSSPNKGFVNVNDGSSTYYGGAQSWWSNNSSNNIFTRKDNISGSFLNTTGCGPVAFTNIIAYNITKNYSNFAHLLKYTDENKTVLAYDNNSYQPGYVTVANPNFNYDHFDENFYFNTSSKSFTKDSFHKLMDWHVFLLGKPGLIGTTDSDMNKLFDNLTEQYPGLSYTKKTPNMSSASAFENFIQDNLNNDDPVLLLNWLKGGFNINGTVINRDGVSSTFTNNSDFKHHWVTITKYFQDGDTKERYISVSSWGQRYTINLSVFYDDDVVYSTSLSSYTLEVR